MKIALAAIVVLVLFLVRVLLWLPWGTRGKAQHPARFGFLVTVGVVVLGMLLLAFWVALR